MNEKPSFFRKLMLLPLQGILTLFPLVLTVYLVFWIVSSLERSVGSKAAALMPQEFYFPGLGLLVTVAILFVVGWIVNAYFIRKLIEFGESLLQKIPLVKTIYTGLRDLVGFMSVAKKQDHGSVVLVEIGDKRLIGFVTDFNASKTLGLDEPDLVGVYMPLGYMIGGYTVYVNKSKLTQLKLDAEDAMRIAVTGGMASGSNR